MAPTAPVLAAGTGLSNSQTPAITGTAEAGSTVTISNGATVLGSTVAAADGTFSFRPSTALADGNYVLTARAVDAVGNTSLVSSAINLRIDTVAPAAPAITAFNQRTTPEIEGWVGRVSADVTTDQKTGMSFYTARIHFDEAQKEKLGQARLVPGMPVEAFLQINERSVLSFLTKPLADQIARAWRER
ncbi:hypothetical protein MMMDOFMJ_1096 [Methylobacterium gnaphalii]|uniref:Uncharacterized protein n=1 Tax=Methylobacterium gnaphalii TaxID=1010610 RepID=A0A512JHB2_9HYPH|nr:hypothetical protein MGN01_11860 [Methylobacterium gnaphalii]GJD68177.1 hypothetical protein MMMDOFMJ_1096 [Methylobacterium gnaphalii]GLS51653.1 hypothetical protein GCM10007885_45120 [Methylobacterium gnaphalii]